MQEKSRKHNNSQGEAEFRIRYVIKYYESHWDAEMLSRDINELAISCASVPLWLLIQSTLVAAIIHPSSRLLHTPTVVLH